MKKLERDALLADRETVRSILAGLHVSDLAGKSSFERRLNYIEQRLQELEAAPDHSASIALFFSGQPVIGSRSIDADFASRAIGVFQDLVTKKVATEERGELGERGPLPLRTSTALAIRDVVRGSFGFVLEESAVNGNLADTALKTAVNEITEVIAKTASESNADFEVAVETLDARLLSSLKTFFRTLDENQATLRIIEDEREESLNSLAIRRGRLRVDDVRINDVEVDNIVGQLVGLVPIGRRFEMRLQNTDEIIRGNVKPSLAQEYMALIETPDERLVGQTWVTRMRIRQIEERNRPPRLVYTLLGLVRRL